MQSHITFSSFLQSCPVLYCTVLSCTVLSYPVLYCPVLYCPILYCTVLSSCYTLLVSLLLMILVCSHKENYSLSLIFSVPRFCYSQILPCQSEDCCSARHSMSFSIQMNCLPPPEGTGKACSVLTLVEIPMDIFFIFHVVWRR